MNPKKLYEMKLHDELAIGSWTITRVMGGWIYTDRYHPVKDPVYVPEPEKQEYFYVGTGTDYDKTT